jgi:HTH-type transcriptional regulator/antitoxin HigA
MAATYEDLLLETLPAQIENDTEYDRLHARFSSLVRKRRDAAEQRLFKLLGLLIEDYDRRQGIPPDDSTPAEILQFLLEHSGKTPADLLPIFRTKSHVSEALNGKRPISAAQARELGGIFRMNPGLFV